MVDRSPSPAALLRVIAALFGNPTMRENGRMDAAKFPWFANLYGCYFHQDWLLDDATSDDVLRRYTESQPPNEVAALKEEMKGLIATNPSESDLDRDLGPFVAFRPANDGLTIREWVEHLLVVLGDAEAS
jgi:hypothetical protein